MATFVTLEKLTYAIRGTVQEFEQMWALLLDFFKQY